MARRRFTVIFTVLGFAFVRVDGRVPAALSRRRPRTGGFVQFDARPEGRRRSRRSRPGQRRRLPARFEGRRPCAASSTTCARPRSMRACRRVLLKPTGFESPYWGKVQEIRDAVLDFKKSGKPVYAYIEYGGDREYYLRQRRRPRLPDAVEPARSQRRRDLSGVSARHARQDRRVSRPAPHRRLQDRVEPADREGLHACAQGDGRVAQPRLSSTSSSRGIADGRKKNAAEVERLLDEGPFLPEDALRAGLVDDVAYEDQVDEQLKGSRGAAKAGETPKPGDASVSERPAQDRRRRLRAHRRVLVRPEPRAADRRDLRHRHHQQRQERLRSAERRDRRRRHAHRRHPAGAARQHRCARSCFASTAPAGRRRRPMPSGAS